MMYLSTLLIDVGTDPDRPRPGRLWLRNRYHVHQRLCMAFPSQQRRDRDPAFLEPYEPEDFAEQVHVPRSTERGFLFRIDPPFHPGRVAILVQSAVLPNWEYAFQNVSHILAAPPQWRPFDPSFEANQRLRFRLLANPVRRVFGKSRQARGELFDEKYNDKLVAVPTDDLAKWLHRRAEEWSAPKNPEQHQHPPGFRIVRITEMVPGYVYVNDFKKKDRKDPKKEDRKDPEDNKGWKLRSCLYEGVLEVTDPDLFRTTLVKGIGHGKAFGFGLLTVVPAKGDAATGG